MYRNVNQASPPSIMPTTEGHMTHPDSVQFDDSDHHISGNHVQQPNNNVVSGGNGEEQINQQAVLAYYNTSGVQMHPQASAPPSGKFTLTPYSAYNQWTTTGTSGGGHGSAPSMSDVMAYNGGGEVSMMGLTNSNRPAVMIENPTPQMQKYHPQPYMNDQTHKEPLDAADVEIII